MPRSPTSRARWSYAAVGVALASAAVVALLGFTRRTDDARVVASGAACAGAPADLDAMWSPPARRALIARNPEASVSAAWLADIIDHRAARWPAVRARCATRAGLACLTDRRAELLAAVATRDQPADAIVAIARALQDPAACSDPAPDAPALAAGADLPAIDRAVARLRGDPDPRALLDYSEALIARAQRLAGAGRFVEVLATAHSALVVQEHIYGTAHPALLPLLSLLASAQDELGTHDDALAARVHDLAAAGPGERIPTH